MRYRSAFALVVAGAMCVAAASFRIVSARADAAPGSGFESFGFAAEATSLKILGPDPNIQFEVPEAVATLRNGPVGYALASPAWPGPIGGNFGALLAVLGFPACSQPPPLQGCTIFNYPFRAEARTTTGPPTVTNENVAGTKMTSTAQDDRVSADVLVGETQAAALGLGSARSTSTATLTGPQAAAGDAVSRMGDIALAEGLVTIDSVVSETHATTDGVRAKGTGRTVLSGVAIAGIPVSIDQNGVHVQDQGTDLAAATEIVNQALSGPGMHIAAGPPTVVTRGGSIAYSAGTVVFSWTPSGNDVVTVILGGATLTMSARRGGGLGGATYTPSGGSTSPSQPGLPGIEASVGSPGSSEGTLGVGGNPTSTIPTNAAGQQVALASGVGAGWILLAVIGALIIGAGARRMAEHVLLQPDAACSVEEQR